MTSGTSKSPGSLAPDELPEFYSPSLEMAAGHQRLWIIAGLIWAVVSFGGIAVLAIYANTPQQSLAGPTEWPADTQLPFGEEGATLVMFAHPHCPCTRASLGELERILARFEKSLTAWVVFFTFDDVGDHWHQIDLRSMARTMSGVRVVNDPGGIEARRFNATVSGQTLLYSPQGNLLFSGGITMARGHQGDNTGRSSIEALLSGAEPSVRQSDVFGCPLTITTN